MMRKIVFAIAAGAALLSGAAHAGTPAENKKLVLDFQREVFEAQNAANAAKYLDPGYIQHNPTVPTGLKGFQDTFGARWTSPKPVQATLQNPPVETIAADDIVIMIFKRPRPEPSDPAKMYDTFWFDAYRVKGTKIVEHWDAATKPAAPPAAAPAAGAAPR
jgi:predicted SnoaL-like aldol condensation-catalyzing enzyme